MAAPDAFDIDEKRGLAILLEETPDDAHRTTAEDAVRQCPTEVRLDA